MILGWVKKGWKIVKSYHIYYRQTGLYKFVFRNLLKLLAIVGVFVLAFYFIERYIIDFDVFFEKYVQGLKWQLVLLSFLISEMFLGLIPPDFYIIWADKMPHNYQMLTYLALLSYIGGVWAYFLGILIRAIPRVRNYVHKRFDEHFKTIKKWGSIIIILASLLPIPFSIISMVAGVIKFPFKNYIISALPRIVRFYLYALIIFPIVK